MTDRSLAKTEKRRARIAHGAGAAVGAFFVATLVIAVGITLTGGEQLAEAGSSTPGMGMFEATTTAAYGLAAAVMSLTMGLAGMITATGAAIISLAIGAIGIAGAVIVGLGVVTGPVLLAAAIGLFIKRRFYPDVI